MLKALPCISKKFLIVSITALFLVSMVFFVSPGKIYGATPIYVNAAMTDDSGNGLTSGTAKKYIQSGITIVDAGGTVNVAAGTYTEDLVIDGKNLTLKGSGFGSDPASNTIVWGKADYKYSLEVKNASSLVVSGFRFSGKDSGKTMFGIYAYDDPIVVNIHDNAFTFINQNGVQLGNGQTGSVIQNNQFIRETRGTVTTGGAGPSFWGCTGCLVKGNTVISVTGVGIAVMGSSNIVLEENKVSAADKTSPSDRGIYVNNSSGITIRGNTVSKFTHGPASAYMYGKQGSAISVYATSDNILIEKNNLVDNSVGVYVATTATLPSPTNVRVNQNNIERNLHYGVLNIKYPASKPWNEWDYHLFGAADATVNATNNYWGSATGPTHLTNSTGSGDAVSDNVNFDPWYVDAAMTTLSNYVAPPPPPPPPPTTPTAPNYVQQTVGAGTNTVDASAVAGAYATVTGSGGQTVTIEKISSATASEGGFSIEGATSYVDLHLDTSEGVEQIQFTILGGAGVPRWWNGSSWIECSDYTIDAAGNVTVTITGSTIPSLSDLTGTVFTVVGKPAITVLGITETTPVEIETVRTNQFTCWQVFVNDKNNFQLIFFWSYKNNNWLKIYDMNDKLVFQKDLAYNDPTIEVSLPDGMYKVKTYHDNWDKPLQEFIIGKP